MSGNFSLEGFGMKGKRMVRKEVHKATEISYKKDSKTGRYS